jgi:hypothetical protein
MNMRAPNLIHGLTFDISFAGAATDSLELADWIKEALLPVMEEVFDQHDRKDQLRRIEQLEIDLGTVSQDESRVELARRLFARLSDALGWSLKNATASSLVEEREQQLGAQLLDFLRTGRLAWSVATDTRVAHQQLLRRVLESTQAGEILRTAINDPQMLTRLLRQFDAAALSSVSQLLFRSWTEPERAAAQRAAAEAGDAQTEAYWHRLLQSGMQPPTAQSHRDALLQLRSMWAGLAPAQRAALREIWGRLDEEVRRRLGSRSMASLSAEARSDLALILRPRALELLATLGGKLEPAQIETALQLLLAGDDAITAVDSMLLTAEGRNEAAAATMPAPHADAAPQPLLLLTRAWRSFDSEQRDAFRTIWQRLSRDVAGRTGGRAVAMLGDTQKAELTMLMLSHAAELLKEFVQQWPEWISPQEEMAFVQSAVQLLLAGDEATATVASMLASASDRHPAVVAPAQLRTLRSHEDNAGGGAMKNHAGAQDRQVSAALLARTWRTFDSAQRDVFRDIWQRLSGEVAIHTGGRAVATLGATQRAELALLLQSPAAELLKRSGLQRAESASTRDETDFVQSVVQVLLDGGYATAAISSMLASTSDQRPTILAAAQRNAIEATEQLGSGLAQLKRIWRTFDPVQCEAFRDIWQHLSDEVARRAGGRALEMLSTVHKADLALTLRPVAGSLLKELRFQRTESVSLQEETDLAESVVQLLLAGDDIRIAAASVMRSQEADVAEDAMQNHEMSQDARVGFALLNRVWRTFDSAQRDAFRHIWIRVSGEATNRAGGRAAATLGAMQKADLALTLRAAVEATLKELRLQRLDLISPRDEHDVVHSIVQLLLAGDSATVAMESLLAAKNDHRPELPTATPRDAITSMPRPGMAALAAITHSNQAESASAEVAAQIAAAVGGTLQSLALLTRVWQTFDPAQRDAFRNTWRRLSGEVASRAGGRILSTMQKADLALTSRTAAEAMLKELRLQRPDLIPLQDESDVVHSMVQLLLAGGNATFAMASLLATAPITAQRDAITSMQQPGMAAPAAIARSDQCESDAAPARAGGVLQSPVAPPQDAQESLALLTRVWQAFNPAQRDAFSTIWRRLSGEVASSTGQNTKATLSGIQVANLALTLRSAAEAMLKELRLQWLESASSQDRTALAQSVVQLLLAGDYATATVESMLAGTSEQREQQASVALLTRVWRSLNPAQRDAFQDIWQRLCGEVAYRADGREVAALSAVQKTDLSLTLRPVAGAMLKKLRHQWPEIISPQDEKEIVQSAVQLLLAGDDATAAATSVLANTSDRHPAVVLAAAQRDDVRTTIDPSLAAFRNWQQGKLDILAQPMTLAELRQWLNWWLLHDPQRANQDCSLMLSAIEAQARHVANPVLFMKLVMAALQSGDALDLEALSLQSGPQHDDAEMAIEPAEAIPLPASVLGAALQSRASLQQFIAQQDTQLSGLNSAQLYQMVRGWLRFHQHDSAASLFLAAIEAHALRALSVHAFLRQVLLHLISDQQVDLEQLLAYTDSQTPATDDSGAHEDVDEQAPVLQAHAAQAASALPAQLKQALPQRLASAMLQADLASLEIIWPEIVRSHASELAEAARRYLGRSDLRARLIARADTGMLKDLLGALSRSALQLAEPVLQHSVQYSAMLASPLTAAEFEQRVLRFAFEQALKPDVVPIEWLHGLMSSIQEISPEQRRELQHAWYEALRAAKRPTLLLRALDQELFARPHHGPRAPEPAASLLLMREAELNATDRTVLASLLQRVLSEKDGLRQGSLESALADPQATERLTGILPSPSLARLFAVLQPNLAMQLPALLRQLHKALPIPLAAVPVTLDRRVWRAIYLAAFADGAAVSPANFMGALVIRLASQYRQADPGAWLEKIAATTTDPAPAAAVHTPDQAMAQLLKPWAEPLVEPPARKPAPAERGEDEPQPFTGESNIHNAGLVIVAPYVQRLFGLLELTVDGKFVSDDAAQRAVHLLQYVVTGEEATPEYLLVLNKLLCGIHGGVPIVPGISITDKEKTIIEQMLNGVITHWSALGKTSIDGLRETFLQRQGHLYYQDQAWQLKIPQKTFDMLLDRLPWSFALIKMPWMAEPLHVTWR